MFSRKQLLVIDDNLEFLDSLKLVLGDDYFLDCAASGQAGLLQFLACEPDCVLLDYRMPGLDGLEIMECMHSQNPRIPVILMSGHDVPHAAFKHGANDFIAKPFSPEELKRMLLRILKL